jgi:hypothetical protein
MSRDSSVGIDLGYGLDDRSSGVRFPEDLDFHHEDGGSMDLRNVGILPQHYTASEPRRPRLETQYIIIFTCSDRRRVARVYGAEL